MHFQKTEIDENEPQVQNQSDEEGEVVSFGSLEDLTNMELPIDDHNGTEDDSVNSVPHKKRKHVMDLTNPLSANATFKETGQHDDLELFGLFVDFIENECDQILILIFLEW